MLHRCSGCLQKEAETDRFGLFRLFLDTTRRRLLFRGRGRKAPGRESGVCRRPQRRLKKNHSPMPPQAQTPATPARRSAAWGRRTPPEEGASAEADSLDGSGVGEGCSVGCAVGTAEGTAVGEAVGAAVGCAVGRAGRITAVLGGMVAAGAAVAGTEVGPAAGAEVGCAGGTAVGCAEGTAVGCAEGTAVGFAEGTAVGCAVGTAVGCAVGAAVGSAVGTAVGTAASKTVKEKLALIP